MLNTLESPFNRFESIPFVVLSLQSQIISKDQCRLMLSLLHHDAFCFFPIIALGERCKQIEPLCPPTKYRCYVFRSVMFSEESFTLECTDNIMPGKAIRMIKVCNSKWSAKLEIESEINYILFNVIKCKIQHLSRDNQLPKCMTEN